MSDRENIQAVATRLRGLREALELSTAEVAERCGVEEATYVYYESGSADIPISFIQQLAQQFGVQVPDLLFGTTPHVTRYYVTRNGAGSVVERDEAYSYQSLAEGFGDRIMHPFLVTIDPANNDAAQPASHAGQEFNYVVEGDIDFYIGHSKIELHVGDSIIFDARLPHVARAKNDQDAKFLAIIAR